jgi:cytosolic iron-sulfur protein assembly protein CIAO1
MADSPTHTLVPVATLTGHTDRVWCVAWSPAGKFLATSGGDKAVRIWAPESRANSSTTFDTLDSTVDANWICVAVLEEAQRRTVRCVRWSNCGRLLAAASFDATTAVWRHAPDGSFELAAVLEGHENEVKAVAWSPGDDLLATCSRDKSVWLWDAMGDIGGVDEDGGDFECTSVLMGHEQDVKCVVFDPAGNRLVSGSYDDTLKIWEEDDDDWFCAHTLRGHTSTVWSVAFEQAGKRLVSCSDDQTAIVWNQVDDVWSIQFHLSGFHTRAIYSVDWSAKSGMIATGGADDRVCIYVEEEPGKFSMFCETARAHSSDVNCVAWHPAVPSVLATAGDDHDVKIWTLEKVR